MENSFGLIKACCCCCCCCRRSYAIKRNASKKRPWPTQICEKLSLKQRRTSRAILRAYANIEIIVCIKLILNLSVKWIDINEAFCHLFRCDHHRTSPCGRPPLSLFPFSYSYWVHTPILIQVSLNLATIHSNLLLGLLKGLLVVVVVRNRNPPLDDAKL